jgi:hypothetical protein
MYRTHHDNWDEEEPTQQGTDWASDGEEDDRQVHHTRF